MHLDAATAGNAEAHYAVEAALHSLLTLKSAPAGVVAILEEPEALRKLCRVLLTPLTEAVKLVLDMLLHILIFSSLGYLYVVKVPLMLEVSLHFKYAHGHRACVLNQKQKDNSTSLC